MAVSLYDGTTYYDITATGAYKIRVTPYGITQMFLLGSDDDAVDILSGGGIQLCSAYGNTATYHIQHDGALSISENTTERVVVGCSGHMNKADGTDEAGHGSFVVCCYPNRFAVRQTIRMDAGSGTWAGRLINISWRADKCSAVYKWAKGTTAWSADVDPTSTRTERATNSATWGLMYGFTPSATEYTVTVTVHGESDWSGADLDDRDNDTTFLGILEQDNISTALGYISDAAFDFLPLSGGAWDANGTLARRTAFLAPDPLSGAAGMGEVLVGTRKTDHGADLDADSFIQAYACWCISDSSDEAKIKLARDTGVVGQSDFFYPAFQVYSVTEALPVLWVKRSTDAVNWTMLADDTDYGEVAIGTVVSGVQTRLVQIWENVAGTVYYWMKWASGVEVTTSSLDGGEVDVAYSEVLAATGGVEPYSWALAAGSDPLPDGLTIAADGTISGTPEVAGTFAFTVEVTDAGDQTDTAELSIAIAAVPTLTTGIGMCENTVPYSQQLAAAGGVAPFTYEIVDGVLPADLTLTSAGLLSGTPDDTPGSFPITIRATDALGGYVEKEYANFTLFAAIAISSTTLDNGVIGLAYSDNVETTGGFSGGTWTITDGVLPDGIVIDSQGWGAAPLRGTPTTAGTFEFTIEVIDALGAVALADLSITVNAALAITTTSLPPAALTIAYSQQLASTGGALPIVWSKPSGDLPDGIELSETGLLYGTPTVIETFVFTVRATDADGNTDDQELSITVKSPPVITTTSLPSATEGVAYSQTLQAIGGVEPLTWTKVLGDLPDNMTLTTGGLLSGAPTVHETFVFTVRCTDGDAEYDEQQLSLTVTEALTFTTPAALPPAFWPKWPYSGALAINGGLAPVTYAVTAGILTPGLALSGAGVISGTPTARGSATFTVTATDANGATAVREFTLQTIIKIFLPGGKPLIRYGEDNKPRMVLGAQDCCCYRTRYAEEGLMNPAPLYPCAEAENTTLVCARPKITWNTRQLVLLSSDGNKLLDTLPVYLAGATTPAMWKGATGDYTTYYLFTRMIYMNGNYYTWDVGYGYPDPVYTTRPSISYAKLRCLDAATGETVWSGFQGPVYESEVYPAGWYYTHSPWGRTQRIICANAAADEIWGALASTPLGFDGSTPQLYFTVGRYSSADGSSLWTANGTGVAGGVRINMPSGYSWVGVDWYAPFTMIDAGGGQMLAFLLAASVKTDTGAKGFSLYMVDLSDADPGLPVVSTTVVLDRIEWTYEGDWAESLPGGYIMNPGPMWSVPAVWRIDGGYIVSWSGSTVESPNVVVRVYAVSFEDDGTLIHGPDVIASFSRPMTGSFDMRYTAVMAAYPDETAGYFGKWSYTEPGSIYQWDATTGAITEKVVGYGICFPAPGHEAWVGGYHDNQPLPYRRADLTDGVLL